MIVDNENDKINSANRTTDNGGQFKMFKLWDNYLFGHFLYVYKYLLVYNYMYKSFGFFNKMMSMIHEFMNFLLYAFRLKRVWNYIVKIGIGFLGVGKHQ